MVREKRVKVNGRLARDPEMAVRLGLDVMEVDNAAVLQHTQIYLMMNKPRGLVTTRADEQGRATVYDLLTSQITEPLGISGSWVAPVGRLDKASEGLLLLTNDSEWAARITDPESHIDKRYHVQVACVTEDRVLQRLAQGVRLGSDVLKVKEARVIRQGGKTSWLEIILDEGRNRHIRRLLAALGVEVLRLVRIGIGPVELGDLGKGTIRPLTQQEKAGLDQSL